MADIVLLNDSRDVAWAQRVSDALSAYGWTVWFSARMSGNVVEIYRQLLAANCAVVLWSRSSVHGFEITELANLAKGKLVQAIVADVRPSKDFRSTPSVRLIGWSGDIHHWAIGQLR